MKTPADLNYRMPAEWEPHRGTWLTWPRPEGISFPGKYENALPALARLVLHLVEGEDVYINAWDGDLEQLIRGVLAQYKVPMERVFFHRFQSYEPWCRDHGPVFITRDIGGGLEKAVVNWGYNAWGEKYPPFDLDNQIPKRVAELRSVPVFEPDMILEGGSIEVNGRGTVLTTEACLLNTNRNPGVSKLDIEGKLKDYLGVTKVCWLGQGIVGDDTDGHIDTLARFINPGMIVTAVESDSQDANYEVLQDNLRRLEVCRDQDNQQFRVLELPMPEMVECEGQRLPATYVNFYIGNQVVVVPTFGCAADDAVLEILQGEFPRRKVVGVDSRDLIWGLGSFHCLTQQEPG